MRRYRDTIALLQTIIKVVDDNSDEFFTKQKLAAAVVYKNKVISIGFNQYKTHTLQKKFSRNDRCIYLHAEVHAIQRALRFLTEKEFRRSCIFVSRIKFREPGRPEIISGIARPCEGCQKAMKFHKIPKAIYSLDDSENYGVLLI